HGEQPAVARIEVEMVLVRLAEIRLLEHERHAKHALPEIDGALPGGADDRGVMDTLDLDLRHAELLVTFQTSSGKYLAVLSSGQARTREGFIVVAFVSDPDKP